MFTFIDQVSSSFTVPSGVSHVKFSICDFTEGFEFIHDDNIDTIELRNCDIRTIPTSMTRCKKLIVVGSTTKNILEISPILRELTISDCDMTQIPQSIIQASHLTMVDLSHNSISCSAEIQRVHPTVNLDGNPITSTKTHVKWRVNGELDDAMTKHEHNVHSDGLNASVERVLVRLARESGVGDDESLWRYAKSVGVNVDILDKAISGRETTKILFEKKFYLSIKDIASLVMTELFFLAKGKKEAIQNSVDAFNYQLDEMLGSCTDGIVTRFVAALVGFGDEPVLVIGKVEEWNILAAHVCGLNITSEEKKELFSQKLRDRGYDPGDAADWLDAF